MNTKPKFTFLEFALILVATILIIVVIAINTGCGPRFDREAIAEVKDTYCADLLELAEKAKAQNIEFTPEEKAAIEFCRGDQ